MRQTDWIGHHGHRVKEDEVRSPPRTKSVEELDELAIQLQATQNSEAHGGVAGVAFGGEPGQGVRGSVKTTGARGVLRLTSTEIFENSQNTTKFTTKRRYVPRFLLDDKRIPSPMFPMCRRGNHLFNLNLSGRGAAAAASRLV